MNIHLYISHRHWSAYWSYWVDTICRVGAAWCRAASCSKLQQKLNQVQFLATVQC